MPVDPLFNEHISLFGVKKAIFSVKQGKTCGFDNIPSEVLHNDTAVSFFIFCLIFVLMLVSSHQAGGNALSNLSLSHVQKIGGTLCHIEEQRLPRLCINYIARF